MLNNSTLTLSGGSINKEATVVVEEGSSIVQNATSSALSIDSNDSMNGKLNLVSGILDIVDQNDTTGKSIVASQNKIYNQVEGTSNISNSTIILDTIDASITGGIVNLAENSTLSLSNGLINYFSFYKQDIINNISI